MDEIKVFQNESFGSIRVAGTSEHPLFCLADVCKVLELKNPRDVKTRLSSKGVATTDTLTAGGVQSMTYINEANLYKCIFQSRKEEAEAFQNWVCDEVLPSIRKQGGYMVAKADESPEEIMARALQIANDTLARREARLHQLESENEFQKKELQEAAPKVNYYDQTLQSVNGAQRKIA